MTWRRSDADLPGRDASPAEGVHAAQHPSHLGLLHRGPPPSAEANVDAIVVPAARPARYLTAASELARDTGYPLLILTSKQITAEQARALADPYGVRALASDFRRGTQIIPLGTDNAPFARHADTSTKRNLALVLCRMIGWERVLYLDDDVTGIRAAGLRTAAALVGRYRAVGLENVGYPDNSVVCHANRDTGGKQDYFVGAGAMVVHTTRIHSFFPNVYNEDWFFLLEDDGLTEVAMSGSCKQAEFDPYKDPRRAEQEEFGDCLAEGLFALLDEGAGLHDANLTYWRAFLAERAALIKEIIERSPSAGLAPDRQMRVVTALRAAQGRLREITPETCVNYLGRWREDRLRWRDYVANLTGRCSPEEALARFGLRV